MNSKFRRTFCKGMTYIFKSDVGRNMNRYFINETKHNVAIFVILLVWSSGVLAADPIEMKGTNIKGSSELPKVLYIVPWKKAELGDILMQAGISMFDDELAPVDRDVFRRQVEYYDILSEQDQKNATAKTK